MTPTRFDVRSIPGIVELFLELGPGQIAELRNAVLAKDAPRLARVAHAFKGSCLTFQANDLAEICRHLEEGGERGDISHAATLVEQLQQQFNALASTLKR